MRERLGRGCPGCGTRDGAAQQDPFLATASIPTSLAVGLEPPTAALDGPAGAGTRSRARLKSEILSSVRSRDKVTHEKKEGTGKY